MKHRKESFTQHALAMAGAVAVSLPVTPLALAETQGFVLEEVVVTARKREESLQDSPLSITAVSGNELEIRQIESTQQLGQIAPNLSFESYAASSGSNSAATVFIRGIGQTDFVPTTDPGVGIYVDGVYLARSVGGALDLLDLERVEVLRGPQGTLFGRNTIGGAVLLHSRKPGDEFSGKVGVKVGSDSRRDFNLTVDVPITDTLKTQFNAAIRRRDGYVDNIFSGDELGDDDSRSLRFAALWNVTDNFEVFFTADYTHEDESGAPTVLMAFDDTQAFPNFGNIFAPGCPVTFPPGQPSPIGDPDCANAQWVLGEDTVAANAPLASELEVHGAALTMTWELDALTIKSITSYRKFDSFSVRDADSTPLTVFHTVDPYDQDQFSQELQFSGTMWDDRIKWIAGLYHFEEEASNVSAVISSLGDLSSGGFVENETQAIFTQWTIELIDNLELTLGYRNSDEEKDFLPTSFFLTPFQTPMGPIPPLSAGGPFILPPVTSSLDIDEETPMVNLSYHWTDDFMTYISYSEGFKSGGFVQRVPLPIPAPPVYDPEFAETHEIGFKWSSGNFRLNGAIFRTDYEDIQVTIRQGIAPVTINGGEAKIEGFELEGVYVPTPEWHITFGLGYLDSDYTELDPGAPAVGITENNEITNTPKWSGNIGISYLIDMGDRGSLSPRVDWSYKDDQFRTANNAEHLKADAYDILNVSLTWESPREDWRVVLAANNITDEIYIANGSDALDTGQGLSDGVYSRGREWTLGVDYRF